MWNFLIKFPKKTGTRGLFNVSNVKRCIYLHVYTGFCPNLFRMETHFMPQELEVAHFGCHHPHELRAGPCGLLFRLRCIGRFLASLVSGSAFSFSLRIFPVDSTHWLTGLQGLKRLKALGDEPILLQDILQLLHILKSMPLQEQSEKSCTRGDLRLCIYIYMY